MEVLDFAQEVNAGEWLKGIVERKQDNEEAKISPTIIVSYRGNWCPFCLRYLEDLSTLYPKIKDFGGVVIMLTSDSVKNVETMLEGIEYPFDYAVSDPTHKVNQFLRDSNLPNAVVTGNNGDDGYTTGFYLKSANSKGHKEGLLQPSIIVLSEEMKPMFEWRIEPKFSNVGGATDRPDLTPVVQLIEDKVNGSVEPYEVTTVKDLSKTTKVKKLGFFDLRSISLALFGSKKKKAKKSSQNR